MLTLCEDVVDADDCCEEYHAAKDDQEVDFLVSHVWPFSRAGTPIREVPAKRRRRSQLTTAKGSISEKLPKDHPTQCQIGGIG